MADQRDAEDKTECAKIENAIKATQLSAISAVSQANGLPKRSEGYELYASFVAYATLMKEQEKRITVLLRDVLRNAGCRIAVPACVSDLEEFLDRLVEANDSICERAGILLDLLQKAGSLEEVVVPEHILDAESTARAEQKSLYERQGRYTALLRRLPGYNDKAYQATTALSLMTAKEKPQIVYNIRVDNSDAKFIPKLKEKHHIFKSSKTNLQIVDIDDDNNSTWVYDQETNEHPYREELIHFEIPERQLLANSDEPLKKISDTELVYIDNLDKLRNLRDILNKEKEFGVDLEHNSFRSYLGLTCLLQISTREIDYIIDPFPLWNDMHILNEPFTDPLILKVFHGADSDIAWLQRDFGIYVVNLFDTHKAMRVLNYSKFSYQHLVQMCCNQTLDKKLQKADWRMRQAPLTEAHKLYARSDTHYLLHCYDKLRKMLINEGNGETNHLKLVYDECVQLCLTVYKKPPFESDGYEKLLLGRKTLNSRQHFALEALWKWRDDRARADDESPQFILPNHMMLQIAEVLPREMQGILACCTPVPMHVKQELHELHRLINTARDQPLIKRQITAPNIDSLTFESVRSQLNKMNAVKAMLKCHLDFTSTKYNEEIRDILTQKIDETDVAESSNSFFTTDTHTIGDGDLEIETERLTEVLQKLEDWATPFECYRIAVMERTAKEEAKEKDNETKEIEERSVKINEKKLWSHLDPAANKLGYTEQKATAAELKLESEQRKDAEKTKTFDEDMILTKSALKRKRKRESKKISIPTKGTCKVSETSTQISSKKARKSNWTNAPMECDEPVDYSNFEPALFSKNVQTSNAYDPFKQEKRGGFKSRHGRMKQKDSTF